MSDTTDLQALFDAASPGATVRLDPNRTYIIEPSSNNTRGLWIPPAAAGLRIDARGAVFCAADKVPTAFNTLQIEANGVTIWNLNVRGGVQPKGTGHRHGVFVEAADVTLDAIVSDEHEGDGIVLYTGADAARILDCYARDNLRNGLTFNGPSNGVLVVGGQYCDNAAQQIDFEIGAGFGESTGIVGATLMRCTIDAGAGQDYALTLGDHGSQQTVIDCVINGGIRIQSGNDIELKRCRGTNATDKAIEIWGSSDRVRIVDCEFDAMKAKRAIWVVASSSGIPGRVAIDDVRVSVHDISACAIEIEGAQDTQITNSQLRGSGVPMAGRGGIMLRSTMMDSPMESVRIDGVSFDSFGQYGIMAGGISTPAPIGGVLPAAFSTLRRLEIANCDFGNDEGGGSPMTTAIIVDRTVQQLVIGPDNHLDPGVTLGGGTPRQLVTVGQP